MSLNPPHCTKMPNISYISDRDLISQMTTARYSSGWSETSSELERTFLACQAASVENASRGWIAGRYVGVKASREHWSDSSSETEDKHLDTIAAARDAIPDVSHLPAESTCNEVIGEIKKHDIALWVDTVNLHAPFERKAPVTSTCSRLLTLAIVNSPGKHDSSKISDIKPEPGSSFKPAPKTDEGYETEPLVTTNVSRRSDWFVSKWDPEADSAYLDRLVPARCDYRKLVRATSTAAVPIRPDLIKKFVLSHRSDREEPCVPEVNLIPLNPCFTHLCDNRTYAGITYHHETDIPLSAANSASAKVSIPSSFCSNSFAFKVPHFAFSV